jgi:hypothetical protein
VSNAKGIPPTSPGPDWETAVRTALATVQGTHFDLPPGTLQAVTERLIESLGQYVLVPKWEYELMEGQRERAARAQARIDELEIPDERIETLRALCDAADHAGIASGGWFTVEAVRKAISVESGGAS